MKTPTWLRIDQINQIPQAVIALPLRAAVSLGLLGGIADFVKDNSQPSTRKLAEKAEELVVELKPTLHGCIVAGAEVDFMTNKLNLLVLHRLLPVTSPMKPPCLIDLSQEVGRLLLKRDQGFPSEAG